MLMWCQGLKVLLWFNRYPPCTPQRLFIVAQNALCPLWWHGLVLLSLVPFAHPNDVLWSGRRLADGTLLGLSRLSIVDGCLYPCSQVRFELGWETADQLAVGVPVQLAS